MFRLQAPYPPAGDQPSAVAALLQGIDQGYRAQTLWGITGSGKTYTMAQVIAARQVPALIMAPNKSLAAQLYREMKEFFPNNAVEYFVSYFDYYQPEAYIPASDRYIEKDSAINDQIEQMRLSAVRSVLERRDVIIICSVSAIYGLGDPGAYRQMLLPLSVGQKIDQPYLLEQLTQLHYKRNDVEFKRGVYRVRGDTIDLFPAEALDTAWRFSLWDGELERIEIFDPLTGEKQGRLQEVIIYPKTHYATPREQVLSAIESIKVELQQELAILYAADKRTEAERLAQRTQYDLEMLLECGYCTGVENYSRHLAGREPGEAPATLLDYFPAEGLFFLDESHVLLGQLLGMERGDRARKENLVRYGFRLPSAFDNRPLRYEEFLQYPQSLIYVSATPGEEECMRSQHIVHLWIRPTGLLDPLIEIRPVQSQVPDLLSEIHKRAGKERVLVTVLTKKMAEDLSEYLSEHGVKSVYMHSELDTVERMDILRDFRAGVHDVLVGINLLREGLDIPEVSLVAIFDADREGFLRSKRSLIQTMGRAARNIHGMAILYADKITPAMQEAVEETQQRRATQMAYNEEHHIVPQGILKPIYALIDAEKQENREPTVSADKASAVSQAGSLKNDKKREKIQARAEKELINSGILGKKWPSDPEKQLEYLARLEKEMHHHAQCMEFEKAVILRDRLMALRNNIS